MCRPDDFPPYNDDLARPDYFRTLDAEESSLFRAWAREHYVPGSTINPLWHPVVRDECESINKEDEHRYDTIEGVTPPRTILCEWCGHDGARNESACLSDDYGEGPLLVCDVCADLDRQLQARRLENVEGGRTR